MEPLAQCAATISIPPGPIEAFYARPRRMARPISIPPGPIEALFALIWVGAVFKFQFLLVQLKRVERFLIEFVQHHFNSSWSN